MAQNKVIIDNWGELSESTRREIQRDWKENFMGDPSQLAINGSLPPSTAAFDLIYKINKNRQKFFMQPNQPLNIRIVTG